MRVPEIATAASTALLCFLLLPAGCGDSKTPRSATRVPAEYADKHMPAGWWNNPTITKEGQAIYLGMKNRDVNCAKCHGRSGKPVKASARDLRNSENMKKYSDSHLFWRISEGIPYTQMRGYKNKLSEEQIWKVIAYATTFGLEGLRYDPASRKWMPAMTTEIQDPGKRDS